MRNNLFASVKAILETCDKLIGEDGTVRVYDFPITSPPGYPYAVISSGSFGSSVLDNARDSRRYEFVIQVVGEKFGTEGGTTQSQALENMRVVEDSIMALYDADNDISNSEVVRTFPVNAEYGLGEGNVRVILNITLSVEVMVNINI